jgi:deoxyribonuclease V
MRISSHRWDLSPREAVALQKKLAGRVIRERRLGPVATVAGIDVGFCDGVARAAVVVLSYPELEVIDSVLATLPVTFPYIPGLLTFREGPVILDAMGKLGTVPDLLIFDGQGIAHPRRLGIASHIGLLLDLPSIGCAKSRLCGQYEEPCLERDCHVPLIDHGEIIGEVVRTRSRVKPVFVSIGHRVDLSTGIEYVLACCRGYRLPETTRWADRLAGGKRLPMESSVRIASTSPAKGETNPD